MRIKLSYVVFIWIILLACSNDDLSGNSAPNNPPVTDASVTEVAISGEALNYQFAVTIASPDTGCDQYADWWEVVSGTGELLYRRVLLHSHVGEQPFTRSGGPVAIQANQTVWVRVHMNNTGYSTHALRGTVADGFVVTEAPNDFAQELQQQAPLPNGCNF